MSFELHNVSQSSRFFKNAGLHVDSWAHQASTKKSNLMRASGPIIGVANAGLELSSRVATVAETIIKGLANVFGSAFTKKCDLYKGMKQIFFQLPFNIYSLILAPINLGVQFVQPSIGMLVNPVKVSKKRLDVDASELKTFEKLSKKDFVSRKLNLFTMANTTEAEGKEKYKTDKSFREAEKARIEMKGEIIAEKILKFLIA